jgi:molybdopterin-guanine dinucleotide biosynthesis protein A
MPLSVVIQAGGNSSRMGQNKALMNFCGQPLISRVIQRIQPVAAEILITTNQPEDLEFLRIPLAPDVFPGQGPLGGLFTALISARYSEISVIACDMPLINPQVLLKEYQLLLEENVAAVVPATPGGLEPLHAVYRRDACLPPIQAALEQKQKRVTSWFQAANVRILSVEETMQMNPGLLSFFNINTPEDFVQGELLAKQEPVSPEKRYTNNK